MTSADLRYFKEWFTRYCRRHYSPNAEYQKNILLKESHTFRVCENILRLADDLSLISGQRLVAETVALFHDVGRFPQYARFRTFKDSISVNHGLLGAETLIAENILRDLPREEREIIVESVKFHNAFSVPKKQNKEINLFIKLIRDADKLDIWRVFIDHYESPEESRASAVGLGLPNLPEYSPEVLSCICRKEIVSLGLVRTLNDFKLLQLSWIFDLNFRASFRLLSERDYARRIIAQLPQAGEIQKVSLLLEKYVQEKLETG
mgnify:CR=1 FL=1